MKVWRCKICGDSYIGTRRPSNCAFCGAREKLVLLAADWQPPERGDLGDMARKIVERALEMELIKAAFYACAADKADGSLGFAVFDALSREHGRHASVMRRILGLAKPSTGGQGTCHEATEDNLEEGSRKQKDAVRFYQDSYNRLSEPVVREVFSALAEIEIDEMALLERLLADIRK
jgi:rubrerythrin